MIRFLDSIGYLLFLSKLMILIHNPTQGQELPTEKNNNGGFFFHDSIQERFYDTKILPDGSEVSHYLLRNESLRVFFLVQEDDIPVYILVTPCASKVEWTVTHRSISFSHQDDHEDADPFFPQNEISVKPTTSTGAFLQQYTETSANVFSQTAGEKGMYTIDLRSVDSDTYVRLYATTTPFSDHFYPSLPLDAKVEKTVVKRRSFGIAWKPSSDETPFDNIIEYCVQVNRKRFYSTHCSLMSHMNGDPPPSIPKNAGFNFEEDEIENKSLLKKARPVKARKNIFYKCVGSTTRFTYRRARSGKKYFVNVFVRNKRTNRTSAYEGIVIKTKKGRSLGRLKDGKTLEIEFKKPRQKHVFKYRLKADTQKLLLAVHSCNGRIKIQVYQRGKEIFKAKVRNVQNYTLKNLKRGQYVIKMTNSRKGRRNARLLVTTNPSKFRYPRLPNDTRIIIVNNLTTCNNITIAFLGTEKKQTYCVYKTEVTTPSTRKRRRRLRYDQCLTLKQANNEVKCLNFRHQNKKSVLTHTISGLQPGKHYRFDVSVKQRGKYSLAYQSEWAQTKDEC